MDYRLYRNPGEQFVPFGKNKRLPQPPYPTVPVKKRVDEFYLKVDD